MADNEEGDEATPRGNEWEVVSLTASAYAAAPGPKQVDSSHDSQGKLGGENEAEASSAMFMSGQFIFPPNQHENLPHKPEYSEINDEKGGDFDVSHLVAEDVENTSIKELMSDEFSGVPMFDQKANRLSASSADFEKDVVLDKENSISSSAESGSFTTMDKFNTVDEGEGTDDILLPQDHTSDSGLLNFQKPVEGEKCDGDDLPCEAWWKRPAVSLYAQAKEANTFWSIFIAAAVVGLVIIGHRWQKERWQVLHLK